MSAKKNQPETINPNLIKGRDPLILALICGATKSGVHKDKKKDAARKECRKPVRQDD